MLSMCWLTYDWSTLGTLFLPTSYPIPPIPHICTPPSSLTLPTSTSICKCNPLPVLLPPLYLSLSLQGYGTTAFLLASEKGHTEAMKLLLNASDIDVNHEDVSLYLLSPSYLAAGGWFITHLPHVIPYFNPCNDDLPSLIA